MKRTCLFIALLTAASFVSAAPWTYRGTLNDAGKPANGQYDLRLTLVNEAGTQSVTQPITLMNVAVKEGNFAAQVDFGLDLTNAPVMKLKTEVAQGGSGFMALGEPTRFDAKAALAGICWDTTGNIVAAGEFLGSTNNVPLVLKAGDAKVVRIEGGFPSGAANIETGAAVNTVLAGISGQTIAGGGSAGTNCGPLSNAPCRNLTSDLFATVSGGSGNRATGSEATVSGGSVNFASRLGSTVGGGGGNSATEVYSTVSGGERNVADGRYSTVVGGIRNTARADYSTVGGGFDNCAGGAYSWAGGSEAKVRASNASGGTCGPSSGDSDGDEGTFVWASPGGEFASTGPNQFLVRAQGGMGLNTTALGAAANLRSSELVVRNGVIGDNTDISLMNDTNRGYNLVSVPNGINAGSFAIGEVDARTASVSFVNRLLIAPNGDLSVSAGAFKPGGGAWAISSDARLKQDVSALTGSLARLLQLRGVNFTYRHNAPKSLTAAGPQIGFIAQEVEQVFPQWIGEKEGFKTVGIAGFEALTVEALRELRGESAVIDTAQSDQLLALKAENSALRAGLAAAKAENAAQNAAFEARLQALESKLD